MFVSWVDEGYYSAHDSHIEPLENRYPLEKHHVQDFTKYENDIRNLWAFTMWAIYKDHSESVGTISSRITELDPNYSGAWNNKGNALSGLGRHKEAISCYDKALEIDPNYSDAWYNRALSNVKKGDTESALADLKKATELDKNNIELAKLDKDFESIRNEERFKALVME